MTETEWHNSTDPGAMIAFLLGRASPRKLRLFACASARRLWEFLRDERSRHGIEVSELFADGQAAEVERDRAWRQASDAHEEAPWYATRQALAAAWAVWNDIAEGVPHVIEDVTRVFGRQAALDAARLSMQRVRSSREQAIHATRLLLCELAREVFGNPFRTVEPDPAWLADRNEAARRVASVIYQERRFEHMPILADALEEAGCDDADLLDHCREPREHVLGCWVLDLLLGKE